MFAYLKTQKHHKAVVEFGFKNSDAAQLDWENDHEFSYNNVMYDVIEKKTAGDRIIVRCIADDHETELVNEYQKSNKHNQTSQSIIRLITASFVLPENVSVVEFEKEIRNRYFGYSSSLRTRHSSVPAPPPDVC